MTHCGVLNVCICENAILQNYTAAGHTAKRESNKVQFHGFDIDLQIQKPSRVQGMSNDNYK